MRADALAQLRRSEPKPLARAGDELPVWRRWLGARPAPLARSHAFHVAEQGEEQAGLALGERLIRTREGLVLG